ncbi:MAG: hypothetical protein QXP11_00285, partial [Sulfolobales archaeon]
MHNLILIKVLLKISNARYGLKLYIFAPLNLPEYYLWLTPLLSIYALTQNNLRLCIALTLSIASGRLWQEFIQSSTTFNPYIHTTLTITYIIAQLLVLKQLLI